MIKKGIIIFVMQKSVPILTCGLNTDLSPTITSVEMDCATQVHTTRSGGYMNGSERDLTRLMCIQNRGEM